MPKLLALNATVGSSDEEYIDLMRRSAPGYDVDIVNVRETIGAEVAARVLSVFANGGVMVSSGSDIMVRGDDVEGCPLNIDSEVVTKMVDTFTYLLLMSRKGMFDIDDVRALLICFSAQIFSLSLVILNAISEADIGQINSFDDLASSEFGASNFCESDMAQGQFPIYRLPKTRIGYFPLAGGLHELFFHSQAINSEVLSALGEGVQTDDVTSEGIVQSFSFGGFRGIQYHPELESTDLKSRVMPLRYFYIELQRLRAILGFSFEPGNRGLGKYLQ